MALSTRDMLIHELFLLFVAVCLINPFDEKRNIISVIENWQHFEQCLKSKNPLANVSRKDTG